MIIQSIKSENFLKYENLDLSNLPERGLIAVSGQNESGKTTIGETLCFALFGRTFTLELDDPKKMIRWSESRCSVSVVFAVRDKGVYEIRRYLDNEGSYGARLMRYDDGAVLAKGADRVDEEVQLLLGFGYEEFIESFYLAQRELSTPHPHSHTIKVMAGIAPLAKVSREVEQSIGSDEAQKQRTSGDYDDIRQQITALNIDENWFPDLSNAYAALESLTQRKEDLIAGLQASADNYRESLPLLRKKQFAWKLAWFLGFFFLFSAIALWVLWGIVTYAADTTEAEQILSWASLNVPGGESGFLKWILPISLLMTALAVFEGYMLFYRLKKEIKRLEAKVDELATQLDKIRLEGRSDAELLPESVRGLLDDALQDRGSDEADSDSEDNTEESYSEKIKLLETQVRNRKASRAEVSEGEAMVMARLNADLEQNNTQLGQIESAREAEQARLDEAARLVAISDDLDTQLADSLRRIKVQQVATSLLGSAAYHLSHRFNQSILKLAGDALPKFTQNRYKHLKIDDNLDVRVFSNEKHDFMGFEEVSSGTQRQIMLALRLAMSQELINAIEGGKQFIYFDEPFAFFDQDRIRETLGALPQFSDEISQIWLVAQEFPDNVEVDLTVACSREQSSLSVLS